MKWSQIAAREPALGAVARDRLIRPGVLLIETTRRDGSARISGVAPLVMDGELWLSMMRTSAKAADLPRDPRILLHSIVTGPEPAAEVKVRGTVRSETLPAGRPGIPPPGGHSDQPRATAASTPPAPAEHPGTSPPAARPSGGRSGGQRRAASRR